MKLQLVANSITILLALIAGFIALYQVKSNIISSSRIKWIDNLRIAISNYSTEIVNCAYIVINSPLQLDYITDPKERESYAEESYNRYINSSNKADIFANQIKLYLNSKEEKHQKIEELINEIGIYIHNQEDVSKIEKEVVYEYVDEIIQLSKIIFKEEWEKSKKIFKI